MTAPPGERPGRCAALSAPHLNGHILMGYTEDILNDIRSQIDAHPEPLAQARTRLDLVTSSAIGFTGALRTYRSGSLPQHTFIHPVGDGDGFGKIIHADLLFGDDFRSRKIQNAHAGGAGQRDGGFKLFR